MARDRPYYPISWSTLHQWEGCNKQWDFAHGPGKVVVLEDQRGRARGSVAALLFDEWAKRGCPPNWMYENAKVYWERFTGKAYIKYKSTNDKAEMFKKLLDGLIRLEHQWFNLGFQDWNISTEVSIAVNFPDEWQIYPDVVLRMRGKIDILLRHPKYRTLIGDLKFTDNLRYADPHQLNWYALGTKLQWGDNVSKTFNLLPFRKDPLVPWQVPESNHNDFRKRVHQMVDGIREGIFEPTGDEDTVCFWCPWKRMYCPKYAIPNPGVGTFEFGEVITPEQSANELLDVRL